MPAVRTDTSKRLGELLLKGWAMLAESCPECKVPLMRDRASGDRLCVNCDTTFKLEGQVQRGSTAVAGSGPSNAGQGGSNTGQADGGAAAVQGMQQHAEVDSDEGEGHEDEGEYDARQDPRLGPFAAANTARVATAAVSSDGPESAGLRQTPPLPHSLQPQQQQPQRPEQQQQAGARASPAPGRTDDVADLLSTKMLQGWALLDKYCPRCSTVLVRNKAKRMFCVACDAWVMSENEQQQQEQKQQQQQDQQQQQQQQRQGAVHAAVHGPAAVAPGEAAAVPQAAALQGGAGGGEALLCPAALGRAVARKAVEVQALLEATPAADVGRVRECVAVLRDCVELLARLGKCGPLGP